MRSNPKIFLLFGVVLLPLALGTLAIVFVGLFIGVIILAAGLYFDYYTLRYLMKQLRSWIETSEEGVKANIPYEGILSIPWDTVTIAGYCPRKSSFLFVYAEAEDKLLIMPKEFVPFEQLKAEVRERTPFREISLGEKEDLNEWLRKTLGIEEKT